MNLIENRVTFSGGESPKARSYRHLIHDSSRFEDLGSDANHHADRLAVYSRSPWRCRQEVNQSTKSGRSLLKLINNPRTLYIDHLTNELNLKPGYAVMLCGGKPAHL